MPWHHWDELAIAGHGDNKRNGKRFVAQRPEIGGLVSPVIARDPTKISSSSDWPQEQGSHVGPFRVGKSSEFCICASKSRPTSCLSSTLFYNTLLLFTPKSYQAADSLEDVTN